jgi:hypothetical protein
MTKLTRFARIFALGCALASPIAAETDPQPTLLEFFSINRLGTVIANSAIAALRTQMELEYEFLSTDVMRGTVSISGITARPLLPYDQARQCVLTIERAVLNTDVAKPYEVSSELNINMIGARASSACLPPDVAMGLRATGMTAIELEQFKVRGAYIYPTGETSLDASLVIGGFAALDFSTSGMILPRIGRTGPSEPAFRVLRAVVSLKDMGGWQTVSALLPQNMRNAETIKVIGAEQVTQFLSNNGLRTVTAVERNFVTQLMDRVGDFINDPGELTIEARLPDTGIVVEPELYSREPQALISTLALEARAAPLSRTRILGDAQLAALSNPSGLGSAELLALGQALLNGEGVPQTPALVPDLLTPVLSDAANAPQAAALIARAMMDRDASEAYPFALQAAAGGIKTAVSLLDRLESQMTTSQVLDLQGEVHGPLVSATTMIAADDPRDLRRLALAYLAGTGVTRSYMQAYYFALLAEAAGDIGASALKTEIEDRFAARGADVAARWNVASAEIQAKALVDWINDGLATRYKRN